MKRYSLTKQLASSLGMAAMALATPAFADLDYEVRAGVGHSDNITRVSSNEIDQETANLGARINWLERTRRFDGRAEVDAAYVEYLDDAYDSEIIGNGDVALTFGIVPERFEWHAQESFGQANADPFTPSTPETRENINYFSTGPDVIFNFSGALDLRLFGRYSLVDYEESPLDAERTTTGVALGRQVSGASRLAFNATLDGTDFDEATASDYERRAAFVSYLLDGGRTTLAARAGYTWIDPDAGEESSGELLSVSLRRQVSSSSYLVLMASSEITDNGQLLRDLFDGEGAGPVTGGTQLIADSSPFRNRDVLLQWRFERRRTAIGFGVGWNESEYETQSDFGATRVHYQADFTRQMRPTLELSLNARLSDEDFENDISYQELETSLGLTWRMGRHLGLRASLQRIDRDTDDGLNEFTENRFMLAILYSGGATRSGAAE
jgi:hypothetical protein